MTTRHLAVSFSLFLVAAAQAQAQPLGADDLMVPIHSRAGNGDDPDYGWWAGAGNYKVSFHDGFAFYPRLGDGFHTNLPLRWQTVSVSVGGQVLAGSTAPMHRHSEWRFEYVQPGCRETYDVRADGVEQSFVCAQKLGHGDLVVRGRITTALSAPAVGAAHQAIDFEDAAGTPIVRYGHAFARDAAGNSAPATTAWDGDTITLSVASAWLEQAVYPVTLDPLTSSLVLHASSLGAVVSTDIGTEFESSTRTTVYAIERAFSATDHDVYAYRSEGDFGGRALLFSDLSVNNSDRHVAVAFSGGADRWLIAFERLPIGGRSEVWIYYHDKLSSVANSGLQVRTLSSPTDNFVDPDLGGANSHSPSTRCLLVAQHRMSAIDYIESCGIDAQARQLVSNTILWGGPTTAQASPAVTQVALESEGWMLAWQQRFGNGVQQVYGAVTNTDGTIAQSGPLVHLLGRHVTRPCVAGYQERHMLTFNVSTDASSELGAELRSALVQWPIVQPVATVGTHRVLATAVPPISVLSNQGLAFDSASLATWLAVYTRAQALLPASTSAFSVRLGGTGVPIEQNTLFALAGHRATGVSATFNRSEERYPIVYGTDESASNWLVGQLYEYPADAAEFLYGVECGTAMIGGSRPYIGNTNYHFGLVMGPPNTVAIGAVSLAATAVPLDGLGLTGCVLNVDPALLVATVVGITSPQGWVILPFPMSDDPGFVGDLHLQILYASPGANPANLQATRGLRAQFR